MATSRATRCLSCTIFSGAPWKTQQVVHNILQREYSNGPVAIRLPGNKTFRIVTHAKKKDATFIRSTCLNGRMHTGNAIGYAAIAAGGTLEITLQPCQRCYNHQV